MSERKRPGFMLYHGTARTLANLPREDAGELIRAVCLYELEGQEPTIENPILAAVFQSIKAELEEDARRYQERCEQNARNIRARWEDDANG